MQIDILCNNAGHGFHAKWWKSLRGLWMIICAVLAALTTVSVLIPLWKVKRFAAGAQIITSEKLIAVCEKISQA